MSNHTPMREQDPSHLAALEISLSHERSRLTQAAATTERQARSVWVDQLEREIAAERAFLGMQPVAALPPMSDDELAAELLAPSITGGTHA